MFHPNIPPPLLRMVNGYVATDTVVPSVENILCNKLNIQNPSLFISAYIAYFPRPSALENIPTLGTIYTDIPHGRDEYLVYNRKTIY